MKNGLWIRGAMLISRPFLLRTRRVAALVPLAVLLALPAAAGAADLNRASTVQEWLQSDPADQHGLVDFFVMNIVYAAPEDLARGDLAIKGHHVYALRTGRVTAEQLTEMMRRHRPVTQEDLTRPVVSLFLEVLTGIYKVPDAPKESANALKPLPLPDDVRNPDPLRPSDLDAPGTPAEPKGAALWWALGALLVLVAAGALAWFRQKAPPPAPSLSGGSAATGATDPARQEPGEQADAGAAPDGTEPIPGLRAVIGEIQAAHREKPAV